MIPDLEKGTYTGMTYFQEVHGSLVENATSIKENFTEKTLSVVSGKELLLNRRQLREQLEARG